ncbi:MAG: hypothetical protein WA323_25795 [Candidatus Nitrosopolaris sp.]
MYLRINQKKYNHKDTVTMLSLLLLGALVATILSTTVLGAQTVPAKQPNLQAQISNASSAKNTNSTASVPAPHIGNTQQLSKALENKTGLLKK